MTITAKVDAKLHAWLSRWWTRCGAQFHCLDVRYSMSPHGAFMPVGTITRDRLEACKDSHGIGKEVEDLMLEHSTGFFGKVYYELTIVADGNTLLTQHRTIKIGTSEQATEEESTYPLKKEDMTAMMFAEHRQMFKMTTETFGMVLTVMTGLNRETQAMNERLMGEYPKLLDLMSALADKKLERDLALRKAVRIDSVQEKALGALFQIVPQWLAKASEGTPVADQAKMLAAKGQLETIMKSLHEHPEQAAQILQLMPDDAKLALMQLGESFDPIEQEEKKAVG